MDIIERVISYFKEVRLEIRKVNWPTRQQVWQNTLLVIGISFVVALYLGGIDFIFTTILNRFILQK